MQLFLDCGKCMQTTPRSARQSYGCGFLPRPPASSRVPLRVWKHEGDSSKGELAPKTCPGYTCALPEVREASRARIHWLKGDLQAFTGGAPATPELVSAIEILDAAYADQRDYATENPIREGAS